MIFEYCMFESEVGEIGVGGGCRIVALQSHHWHLTLRVVS